MQKKVTKEVTVKEANSKAEDAKTKLACEEGIIRESLRLYRKEHHSVQLIFAYCRQLEKLIPKKNK